MSFGKFLFAGRGWSSPVVWDDQVWVLTAPNDGKQTQAICVNLKSGEIEHNLKLLGDREAAREACVQQLRILHASD